MNNEEIIKEETTKTEETPEIKEEPPVRRRKPHSQEERILQSRKATIKHNVIFYLNGTRIYDCDRVLLDAEPTGNDIYRLYDRGIFCGTLREGDLDFV